ncbi:hypothetical protein GGS26DRAFT_587788 [Hypomontagnella submonticulosa]|nr:hypothetical protein GGS26DRAFT_587788 [Hypomontagnella submonticulosa]
MMFKITVLAFLTTALYSASASEISKRQEETCWTGQIHSPCNGFTTGCTPDGIMVKCQGTQMIWASMCGGPYPPWNCTYDASCDAYCATE